MNTTDAFVKEAEAKSFVYKLKETVGWEAAGRERFPSYFYQ